jgi:hypothetical protein
MWTLVDKNTTRQISNDLQFIDSQRQATDLVIGEKVATGDWQ